MTFQSSHHSIIKEKMTDLANNSIESNFLHKEFTYQGVKIMKKLSICKSLKAESQHAIRLHWSKSIFIIFAPQYVNSSHKRKEICFKCCNLHTCNIFLDDGVMTTRKCQILSFFFYLFYIRFTLCFYFEQNRFGMASFINSSPSVQCIINYYYVMTIIRPQ